MIIQGSRNRKTNDIYNKVYQLWYNMIARCTKEKHPRYKDYGAIGITVCERWKELDNFIEDIDLIDGFDEHLLLLGKIHLDKDKKNANSKQYSLENCSFITIEENNKYKPNQQKLIIGISPNGKEYEFFNQSEFARENGLEQTSISSCIKGKLKTHKGWKFSEK